MNWGWSRTGYETVWEKRPLQEQALKSELAHCASVVSARHLGMKKALRGFFEAQQLTLSESVC